MSAHTQFAVFAQYIRVVEEHGHFPFLLRSDRGVETVMVANAHLALHKKFDPSTSFPRVYRLWYKQEKPAGGILVAANVKVCPSSLEENISKS